MKKYQLCHWILVGTMTALVGCQAKNRTYSPDSPEDNRVYPEEKTRQPDRDPSCRGGECDEWEAGEEAGTHVIEIESVKEESAVKENVSPEKNAATVDNPASQESQKEEVSETSSQKPAVSEEVKLDQTPKEPVTNASEHSSTSGPMSESAVNLP